MEMAPRASQAPAQDGQRFEVASVKRSADPEAAGNAAPDSASSTRTKLMLRSLLAERFKLTIHYEARKRKVYALTVVRTDRRTGPNLEPTQIDCSTRIGDGRRPLPKA